MPPAAAVDTQAASSTTRPPSRPSRATRSAPVAVEHAERAVARAEGSAHHRRVRWGDGRAALDGVDQALGREEGDAVARRSLLVCEGDGASFAVVAPAGCGVRGSSQRDSRVSCDGDGAWPVGLSYYAPIYGGEDPLALLTVRDFRLFVSLLAVFCCAIGGLAAFSRETGAAHLQQLSRRALSVLAPQAQKRPRSRARNQGSQQTTCLSHATSAALGRILSAAIAQIRCASAKNSFTRSYHSTRRKTSSGSTR